MFLCRYLYGNKVLPVHVPVCVYLFLTCYVGKSRKKTLLKVNFASHAQCALSRYNIYYSCKENSVLNFLFFFFFFCYLSNNWFISDHGIYENSELENNMSEKETKDDSKSEIKEPASTEEKTNEPSTTQVCILISVAGSLNVKIFV